MLRAKVVVGVAGLMLWSGMGLAWAQDVGDHGMPGHHAEKQDEAKAKLPACPISGDPIDFFSKTMTADGPVYFCCDGCIKKFKKNPDKYKAQVAKQRAMLAKMDRVQVTCPVSGEPVDTKVFTGTGNKKVYFCCKDCKAKYEKDPTRFAAKLADSYSYQTKCPVAGETIDPTVFTDLPTGQRVFFCCAGCDKKFLKNPGKYAAKLAEQGVHIDVKKLEAATKKAGG